MSLEPQTSAKARFYTTKGLIDIELWAKETPVTSRFFLTNVLNNKFAGWEFNRVVKDFIIQLDGSVSQDLFEDEFHSRIRFSKRGVLGSVNLGSRNSNTGKFFITLREAPELQNKNTAFGKVVGDGIYTVLKISEGELNDESPIYPVKVIKSEILIPFFHDLVKDEVVTGEKTVSEKKKKKKARVKLNLGEEEEPIVDVKMRSAHDVLDDRRLTKDDVFVEAHEEPVQPEDTVGMEKRSDNEIKRETDEDENMKSIITQIKHLKEELARPKVSAEPMELFTKPSKERRESETLKTLQLFMEKLKSKGQYNSKQEKTIITTETINDDFDNLDDSESDSDIYSHALKFADNEESFKLANEDVLVTIDESHEQQKRRNDHFYTNAEASTIAKKSKS
jgi:cyclophilin family peptidyl-prolyl cis-trans isomerase